MSYKISDEGKYATSHNDLPQQFKDYNRSVTEPIMGRFNASALIDLCSHHFPMVSPQMMVCALVAKAFHQHQLEHKREEKSDAISFRMMVDILNMPMRKKYLGNYIAYLPMTVSASLPIYEIANTINQRLFDAKNVRADVSMYKLLEFALGSGMANKTNDPVSYIIANISNIKLANNPNFIRDAQCIGFSACANSTPLDVAGAQLNNRPTLCFNLAKSSKESKRSDELFIGFFNTVTDRKESLQILDNIGEILESLEATI